MKKTLLYTYIVSIAILGFTRCKTYQEVNVEVARGSKLEIPSSITSLCFMDRSLSESHSHFVDSTLQLFFDQKIKGRKAAVLDSTCSDTLLFELSERLYNAGLYDIVVPNNRYIKKADTIKGVPPVLTPAEVHLICRQYNTDALFVLDYFKPTIQQRKIKEYNRFYQSIDVKYASFFRVYDGKNGMPIQQSTNSDSFFYEFEGNSVKEVESKIPTILSAIKESGVVCAIDIFNDLIPRWKREKRFFFLLDKSIDSKANKYVADNNWESFIQLYKPNNGKVNKITRSKLEHNIALGYEMLGDLENAILWSRKSYNSQIRNNTTSYLERLITLQKSTK